MSEITQIWMALAALVPSVVFATTSAIGGRSGTFLVTGRIWKRFIAPIAFVTLVCVLALINGKYNHWFLLCYLTYILNIVGYGSKGYGTWFKVIRRTIWSLIRTLSALPIVLTLGTSEAWLLLGLQAVSGVIGTVILGASNPLKAPVEEFLINFASVVFVVYMVV